jgi:Na+-transporting methylmalonyl-CoA/oxaloacetate decarboxylase beta subunit
MEIKVTLNFGISCFLFGVAIGLLFASFLPRLLILGIDIIIGAASIFLVINSLKILHRNANNKSHF